MDERLVPALRKVLEFRWLHRGFGKSVCASCGAERHVDYGDHEQPMTETREACSRSCPWRIVEEGLETLK